jgi:curved DNA-binding protein CbpA
LLVVSPESTSLLELPVDYYGLLGLKRNAGPKEVRDAFAKRVREVHPSDHPYSAESFIRVCEAVAVLGDPIQRRTYDHLLRVRDTDPARPACGDWPEPERALAERIEEARRRAVDLAILPPDACIVAALRPLALAVPVVYVAYEVEQGLNAMGHVLWVAFYALMGLAAFVSFGRVFLRGGGGGDGVLALIGLAFFMVGAVGTWRMLRRGQAGRPVEP